jgi:hypothetical protein
MHSEDRLSIEDRLLWGFLVAVVAWALFGLPFIYLHWDWLMHEAVGFFTFLLVMVAGLQLGLFAWQLWLIRESLDDTKMAAEAAKQSADAAKIQAETARGTLKVMQDTAERQLRAYISVAPEIRPNIPDIDVSTGAMKHVMVIKNVGQTPATNVVQYVGVGIHDFPSPNLDSPHDDQLPYRGRTIIVPGQEVKIPFGTTLTPAQLAAVQKGDAQRLYVWGLVIYKDIFGVERRTRFQMDFGGEQGFKLGALRWSHDGNEAT